MKRTDTAIKLLTLAEAATILKISKRTLHRMIQHRQIPAFKVGGQWRILESRFQEWVQVEENSVPRDGQSPTPSCALLFVADAIRIIAFLFQQNPTHSHSIFVVCQFSDKLIAEILVPSGSAYWK